MGLIRGMAYTRVYTAYKFTLLYFTFKNRTKENQISHDVVSFAQETDWINSNTKHHY